MGKDALRELTRVPARKAAPKKIRVGLVQVNMGIPKVPATYWAKVQGMLEKM